MKITKKALAQKLEKVPVLTQKSKKALARKQEEPEKKLLVLARKLKKVLARKQEKPERKSNRRQTHEKVFYPAVICAFRLRSALI